MKAIIALAILAVMAYAQDESCPPAEVMDGFKYSQFQGQWFEIGHYRNSGASIWSDQCFCSTSNVTEDFLGEDEGDSIYSYVCNLEDENGDIQAFDTTLYNMDPPGVWDMQVVPGFSAHAFSVISMTEDSALVYRCGEYEGLGISYSAQILSRKPTVDAKTEENFKAKVEALALNPELAEYVKVPHGNCTYVGH